MKTKIFLIVAALTAICIAAVGGGVTTTPSDNVQMPGNIYVIPLGHNPPTTDDTLNVGKSNVYGPYRLSRSPASPLFSGFQAYIPKGSLDANDSGKILYQLMGTNKLADTGANWTTLTAYEDTSKVSAYVSLANKSAPYIVFRVANVGITALRMKKAAIISFIDGTIPQFIVNK